METAATGNVETVLKHELAREQRALNAVAPVLRHLMAGGSEGLVSDAVLATVRGMLADVAGQVLALAAQRDPALRARSEEELAAADSLAATLAEHTALIQHCHALACEGQLAHRFHQRAGIDPVLSALFQELIASDRAEIAELAMSALAAQARFVQTQRRMELPLTELPAELLHDVLSDFGTAGTNATTERLWHSYDEGATRLGLLARLTAAMRRGSLACLALDQAGLALFASGLATLAGMTRADAVMACHEGQTARLALALLAAGLDSDSIEAQFALIDPAARPPRSLALLGPQHAWVLLASETSRERGG